MTNDVAVIGRGMTYDRLENVIAHLAVGKAKTVGDRFQRRDIDDAELSAMYRSDWMARKIIDIPVTDALRPWREWQADARVIEAIEAAERRHNIRAKLATALKWARLHGGSAIIALDGSQDYSMPMGKLSRGGLKKMIVVNRREVTPGPLCRSPIGPVEFREPEFYTLNTETQVRIHSSRVVRFVGAERPDADLNTDGWGDSILLPVYDALHHAALTSAGIAELVHEAKVDVIKVRNLASQASTPAGARAIAERFMLANMGKSINNMLLLDETETWDRKQTSFAGLPDVLKTYLGIVAGASDIPATRLLGQSPGGLNSTGESDLRNYYDHLDSYRTDVILPAVERIDSWLWQDIGGAPKDAFWDWGPLWQMSDKDKADVAEKKARTTKTYADMGIMPEDVLFEAVTNQLVEDGTYPGLEAAIATLRSARPSAGEEPTEEDVDAQADRALERRIPRFLAGRE